MLDETKIELYEIREVELEDPVKVDTDKEVTFRGATKVTFIEKSKEEFLSQPPKQRIICIQLKNTNGTEKEHFKQYLAIIKNDKKEKLTKKEDLDEPLLRKKNEINNLSGVRFLYIDEDRIDRLYHSSVNDSPKERLVSRDTATEIKGTVEGAGKGNITGGVVGGELSGKVVGEGGITENKVYESRDISSKEKYEEVIKQFLKKEKLELKLEFEYQEPGEIEELNKQIRIFYKKIGIDLNQFDDVIVEFDKYKTLYNNKYLEAERDRFEPPPIK
ncbi:MAG: hypothetical protein AAF518_16255 [Spirochaetota bacterium]